MSRLLATFFGTGRLPGAPGTWGSLVALPLAWVLHGLGGFPLLASATAAVFLIGLWAATAETRGMPDPDPGEIVIDEVAGQWIALFPLSAGLWLQGADPWLFPWPGWVMGFLAFRFFDILKPWPVNVADNWHTPLGLMLDDVLAGIWAALVVVLAAMAWHGLT